MSDEMPIEIWVSEYDTLLNFESEEDANLVAGKGVNTQYTLVHNNPDYHVIPKSDVDGEAMKALNELVNQLDLRGEKLLYVLKREETIRNALIAQSGTDIVRIPRKVLEGMKKHGCIEADDDLDGAIEYGYDWAINDVLNYKEGE